MKRMLSALLALCLLLSMTPAALAVEAAEETFYYTWSQEDDTHTVTRVDADGNTVMEEEAPAFTHSGTSAWDAIGAIYDDAEVTHKVFSFVVTLTSNVTLVGEPKGEAKVQAIAFQDGKVCWELDGHTLTLENLSLGAGTNNTTTFQNGTVQADSTANHNMLYAKNGGALILNGLTVSRDDGGALASAIVDKNEDYPDEAGENSSVTIKDSILTSGVEGMTTSLGNVLVVNGETASMTLEDTAVTGLAPIYPTASVIGGSLTVDAGSAITATHEKVAAAIVRDGELHLNGGKLIPGEGAYACGGRTGGTLHLTGNATAPTVELRDGDQIVDAGYTGGTVALTCTGNQKVGDLLVTGCTSEEAVNKFISSANNQVGLTYMQEVGGDWTVVVSAAPEKADDYTLTQDERGRYTVSGDYQDGGSYTVIHEAETFQTAINALFDDVTGDGAVINLGDDVKIVGDPKGDGTYPTTGVGEGWITWDLQEHTLTLENICMLADIGGTLTVKNGTVMFTGDALPMGAPLFAAQCDGEMILKDLLARRTDGGCLLGAFAAESPYYPELGVVSGASITATNCDLANAIRDTPPIDPDGGANAVSIGGDSTVSLVNTSVGSAAPWAIAGMDGGTLNVPAGCDLYSVWEGEQVVSGISSGGGTVRLSGGVVWVPKIAAAQQAGGDNFVALRDTGGSKFYLSERAQAETIEVAGPGVVDVTGYTGDPVSLTYTGADVLTSGTLVTGCSSEEIAKKFTLAGGGANVVYKAQPDGTWAAVAAATPLSAAVTEFTSGRVYSISSKEEMERLAALVNAGKSGLGSFFVLTRDIDLMGSEENQWPSIGKKQTSTNIPFQGLFDGGGHTIRRLYINETDPSAMYGDKGLFAYVSENGGVRNLTVEGQAGGGNYVGGVVSHNRGLVENCVSRVDVRGLSSLGGVVSMNSGGTIANCTNYGTVTGGSAGGVVSEHSGGSIVNCTNYAAVTGTGDAGGIVCYNTKKYDTAAAVTGCVNHGAVSGSSRVGGIVASNEGKSTAADCVNHGPVTGGIGFTGGVAGENQGTVTGCVNNGPVLATLYVGGIAGSGLPGSAIAVCQNNGPVTLHPETTGGEECGGVLGYSNGAIVENCVNRGAVTAQTAGTAERIGGVVGAASGGEIKTCYNIGAVSCLGKEVGGIVGYTNGTEVTDCVSLGLSVQGSEEAGRIAGSANNSTLSGNFARADMVLTGGAMTGETQKRDGIDGESIAPTGDWQKAAFAGWDFETTWNEGEGDSLPTLKALGEQTVTLPHPDPVPPPSGDFSGGSSSSKPTVEAGEGGTVKADSKGNVTITPDEGYQIGKITVNGKEVSIPADGVLTGLKRSDQVAVTFEPIPPAPLYTPEQFTDLDPDAWYYDAVTYMLAKGLFRGTSETTFSPNAPMSRAMIFTVLHRISAAEAETMDGAPWYAAALTWAVEQGISDGTNPEGDITREQLATMLWRYEGSPEGSGDLTAFSDGETASPWSAQAMAWAVGQDILSGKGGGVLDPKGPATRAQAAAMFMRFAAAATEGNEQK